MLRLYYINNCYFSGTASIGVENLIWNYSWEIKVMINSRMNQINTTGRYNELWKKLRVKIPLSYSVP